MMKLRARNGQDVVSRLYSSWDFVMLQNYYLFHEFSYLSVLNKTTILLMTMIMYNKVGFIMILEKQDVYNCKLSYILKFICTIQLLLLVFVDSHNRISIILNKVTFI